MHTSELILHCLSHMTAQDGNSDVTHRHLSEQRQWSRTNGATNWLTSYVHAIKCSLTTLSVPKPPFPKLLDTLLIAACHGWSELNWAAHQNSSMVDSALIGVMQGCTGLGWWYCRRGGRAYCMCCCTVSASATLCSTAAPSVYSVFYFSQATVKEWGLR